MSDYSDICKALQKTSSAKIVVFGDYCLDKYLYIDPSRDEKSVETELVAFQVHRKSTFAGVGGTITNNLRALGASVVCVGLVGEDGEGFELIKELEKVGADTSLMIKSDKLCTSTYTKPMRKNEHGKYEELNRLDFRNFCPIDSELEKKLLENLNQAIIGANAVIITDQFFQKNLGAVTDTVRDMVCKLSIKQPQLIFFADSRAFADKFRNVIIKCNNIEFAQMCSLKNVDDENAIAYEGAKIAKRNGKLVFVTKGSRGISIVGTEVIRVRAFVATGELDICGAGDATNAGIVLGLALGITPKQAAILACCISSITIEQVGSTGTATIKQVMSRLENNNYFTENGDL